MSLLNDMMEDCVILNKVSLPDGYGGRIDTWTESKATFSAAIVFDTSIQARRAEAEGVKNLYTITTGRGMTLEFHEVLKRLSDGKIFRVTSDGDDKHTPRSTALDMRQVTAEEWSLPING